MILFLKVQRRDCCENMQLKCGIANAVTAAMQGGTVEGHVICVKVARGSSGDSEPEFQFPVYCL